MGAILKCAALHKYQWGAEGAARGVRAVYQYLLSGESEYERSEVPPSVQNLLSLLLLLLLLLKLGEKILFVSKLSLLKSDLSLFSNLFLRNTAQLNWLLAAGQKKMVSFYCTDTALLLSAFELCNNSCVKV